MSNKISDKLTERLEKTGASDLLDVVIELRQRAEAATKAVSRNEKIAAMKEAYTRNVTPVEEAVRKIGGEVTGHAWINQTVRARVPADRVRELSEHEHVEVLDAPHPIEPESSK
jgi:hypothetical protein